MFREWRLIFAHFYCSLKSRNYRYSLWQDGNVGFYLRQHNKELYDECLEKAHTLLEELKNET